MRRVGTGPFRPPLVPFESGSGPYWTDLLYRVNATGAHPMIDLYWMAFSVLPSIALMMLSERMARSRKQIGLCVGVRCDDQSLGEREIGSATGTVLEKEPL